MISKLLKIGMAELQRQRNYQTFNHTLAMVITDYENYYYFPDDKHVMTKDDDETLQLY